LPRCRWRCRRRWYSFSYRSLHFPNSHLPTLQPDGQQHHSGLCCTPWPHGRPRGPYSTRLRISCAVCLHRRRSSLHWCGSYGDFLSRAAVAMDRLIRASACVSEGADVTSAWLRAGGACAGGEGACPEERSTRGGAARLLAFVPRRTDGLGVPHRGYRRPRQPASAHRLSLPTASAGPAVSSSCRRRVHPRHHHWLPRLPQCCGSWTHRRTILGCHHQPDVSADAASQQAPTPPLPSGDRAAALTAPFNIPGACPSQDNWKRHISSRT